MAGDVCYSIWTAFNMTAAQFYLINPNINCKYLKYFSKIWLKLKNFLFFFNLGGDLQIDQVVNVLKACLLQ